MLVADAYRGSEVKQALTDFLRAAAGIPDKEPTAGGVIAGVGFQVPATADLVVYVGHDALMDFPLTVDFAARSELTHAASFWLAPAEPTSGISFERPGPRHFCGRMGYGS